MVARLFHGYLIPKGNWEEEEKKVHYTIDSNMIKPEKSSNRLPCLTWIIYFTTIIIITITIIIIVTVTGSSIHKNVLAAVHHIIDALNNSI